MNKNGRAQQSTERVFTAGNAISGMKKGARDEAQWLHDLVTTGKITLDDVLDAIAVPDEAMAVWREASTSDNELASFLKDAAAFRKFVAQAFMRILTQPAKQPRQRRSPGDPAGMKHDCLFCEYGGSGATIYRSMPPSPDDSLLLRLPSGSAESWAS